jgi:hypothetical protein
MINRVRDNCRQRFVGAFGLVVVLLASAPSAFAGPAREQVQSAIEKATAILNDPNLKSDAKKTERIERLRQVIFPKFDFPKWQNAR